MFVHVGVNNCLNVGRHAVLATVVHGETATQPLLQHFYPQSYFEVESEGRQVDIA